MLTNRLAHHKAIKNNLFAFTPINCMLVYKNKQPFTGDKKKIYMYSAFQKPSKFPH